MEIITRVLVQNITIVFFFYGLAFYSMGLALILAGRRTSQFRLARAIRPLAWFAILHGINEWMDMVQRIAELEGAIILPMWYRAAQLTILVVSFLMLLVFDLVLLSPRMTAFHRIGTSVSLLFLFWGANLLLVTKVYHLSPPEILVIGDILARYLLAVPASIFGAWALFSQQKTMQQHKMPQFGRDLMISAGALLAYGVLGQIFVSKAFLFPANIINSDVFLQIFGIPVQLFRGGLAAIIAIFMVRALNVFEMENQRKLAVAQQEKLQAQRSAVETERRINQEKDRLNEALRLKTEELSVLLEVSNLLALSMEPHEQNRRVLQHIVNSLSFPDAGLLLLDDPPRETLKVAAVMGYNTHSATGDTGYAIAKKLGKRCIAEGKSVCHHADGQEIVFDPQEAREWTTCQSAITPVVMLGLPLTAKKGVIGALVLAQTGKPGERYLSVNEFNLTLGLSQQLGLSIENARLHQAAQRHEKVLAKLLHRVVDAQESERKRIARELHDATGQSLTAIGLGLRGAEVLITEDPEQAVLHVRQLKKYSTNALGELRRLIANLRPSQLDDLGLDAALHWYCQEFQQQYGVSVRLDTRYLASSLHPDSETMIFRIMQESLSNVAKHAKAESVVVRLIEYDHHIELSVVDDGVGFSPEQVLQESDRQQGWGLLGIQERAQLLGGHCHIQSAPGQGTHVRVMIPKDNEGETDVSDKITVGR